MLWTCLQERLKLNGWKPCHSVIFFVNGNREDREKKRGREKLHSLKGDEDKYMAMELPKTSKQAWRHCPRRHCILHRRMGRLFVSPFFKAPQWGDISRNSCYLYIHSLLFQSMMNRWKSLVKGGVDLVFLSLSTSPHPTPPFYALPWLLDSSLPLTPACFGQSLRAVAWEEFEPACRYCSSFQISITSLVADVHMCCPCVYPERWTLFLVLLLFIFPPFSSGWAVKSEQGHLFMRGSPTFYLLFDLLYLY